MADKRGSAEGPQDFDVRLGSFAGGGRYPGREAGNAYYYAAKDVEAMRGKKLNERGGVLSIGLGGRLMDLQVCSALSGKRSFRWDEDRLNTHRECRGKS